MKKMIYSLLTVLTVSMSISSKAEDRTAPRLTDSLFTHFDAERIMGQSSRMTESHTTITKASKTYQAAYTGLSKDEATGKIGKIYYMIEQFPDEMSAHYSYLGIMRANEKNGIKKIDHLGKEAYFHTDNQNFSFIMVRKGNVTYRIKVNQTTSKTSVTALNEVAKRIADKI